MRRRQIIVSIIIYAVYFVISLSLVLGLLYLTRPLPKMNASMFVPASVIKVSDEQDDLVKVYPIGMLPHGYYDMEQTTEVYINEIEEGWITNLYEGDCRLIINIADSNIPDIWLDNYNHYYYAERIPHSRLLVTDNFAILQDDSTNPFENEQSPSYVNDSIDKAIRRYYSSRKVVSYLIVSNIAVLVLIIIVNIIIILKKKLKL